MNQLVQNLENYHRTFINQERPLPFFNGLADYLTFVLSMPILKQIFDEQMTERRALVRQVIEAEKETRVEMDQAKKKLFTIIKKANIDVGSFERYATSPFPGDDTNILQELKSYEDKHIFSTRFISDDIRMCLFDIVANLRKLGYKEDLKEFVVSDGSRNAFIFSKTLSKRQELVERFENERVFKLWSAFEALLQFHTAHNLVLSGKAMNEDNLYDAIPESGMEETPWFGGIKERMKIHKMALEIRQLAKNGIGFSESVVFPVYRQAVNLKHLNPSTFKTVSQKAHHYLLQAAFKYHDIQNEQTTDTRIDVVECCYTPTTAFITYGSAISYKPHNPEFKKLLRGIFKYKERGEIPTIELVLEISRHHIKNKLFSIKNKMLHNINRQIRDRKIPVQIKLDNTEFNIVPQEGIAVRYKSI